jgi:hypothetical protein
MAKRRQSKSALIREAVAQNPKATAAEIVKTLAARRVKVTAAHVYNVKATSGKPRRGRKGDKYAALIEAKKLADKLGGIEKAREAVEALARLL